MSRADHTEHVADTGSPAPLAASDVLDAEHERLLAFSMPAMESLHQQLASPSLTVLLADRQGFVLGVVGPLRPAASHSRETSSTREASPTREASRLAAAGFGAHPGADADDAESGTFAVFAGNRIVMGITAPILAPLGGVLGILDLSAAPFDNLSHAGALLQTTAGIIEHRLIESDERGFLMLRFHTHPGVLGSPLEALAVFDRESRLVVGNRVARNLLEIDERRASLLCPDCFDAPWPGLVGQAALAQSEPFVLRTCGGGRFFARASLRLKATA
ncbi:MAG: hypothetical protein PWP11_28 [Thauera sp.]|jgi:hypothetical protein|nr:hypothetical protein [Thauera sp.]